MWDSQKLYPSKHYWNMLFQTEFSNNNGLNDESFDGVSNKNLSSETGICTSQFKVPQNTLTY